MTQFKVGQSYFPKAPLTKTSSGQNQVVKTEQSPFAQQLQKSIQASELKFSNHALLRLEQRGIKLSTEQLERLQNGINKAQAKGSRDSIVLMENLAFVVSIKNKTVITAMEQSSMEDQVITNIDSAVLI